MPVRDDDVDDPSSCAPSGTRLFPHRKTQTETKESTERGQKSCWTRWGSPATATRYPTTTLFSHLPDSALVLRVFILDSIFLFCNALCRNASAHDKRAFYRRFRSSIFRFLILNLNRFPILASGQVFVGSDRNCSKKNITMSVF